MCESLMAEGAAVRRDIAELGIKDLGLGRMWRRVRKRLEMGGGRWRGGGGGGGVFL